MYNVELVLKVLEPEVDIILREKVYQHWVEDQLEERDDHLYSKSRIVRVSTLAKSGNNSSLHLPAVVWQIAGV